MSRLILMLVKIEQKYLENLTYLVRGHSIVKFALRGEGVPSKCEHMQTAGDYFAANVCFPYDFFKVVIVHKLLAIIIRFFVGFVKIPASLKISALRNYISFFCVVYN